MLRIAVPNKGALSETAADMLAEAGYSGRRDTKTLHVVDTDHDVEFFYLRPRDIATYVASGALDVGITGRDLLRDIPQEAEEIEALGFGSSTFRFAARPGTFQNLADLQGARIASAYPGLVSSFLAENGVEAELVRLDGAVESSVDLGVADAIADVVETGTTLRQAGLEIFGPVILESEAVLIGRPGDRAEGVDRLLRRLRGVMVARRFVLLDYDLPADLVAEASAITPGRESPTISPLRDEKWVAVRVMIPRRGMNQVMDSLYALGARAILVTAIHAARL